VTVDRGSGRTEILSPLSDQISLVDLLDRLLGTGVVLTGDVVISLAGVDLVQIQLRALIASVRADLPAMSPWSDVPGR
jgi:hypothetical protein